MWFTKKPAPAPEAGVSLEKAQERFVDLTKKATVSIKKSGLAGQKARVALCLDISGSMSDLFRQGIVQDVVERVLALGVNFDDNRAIDVFLFGERSHNVGELAEAEFHGYVDRVLKQYRLEGGTRYAGVINDIMTKYTSEAGDPAYILFVTDGDNSDKPEAERAIIAASRHGLFWQFIGVGNGSFKFLEELDTMGGRFVDNANFFQVNDIKKIGDEELYDRMLGEFPSWLKLARDKKII